MNIPANKLLLGIGSATGITAATVTPAVLSGSSSNPENITDNSNNLPPESSIQTQPPKETRKFKRPNWQHKAIPELTRAGDIQNKYQGLPCIEDYFPEIVNWTNGNDSSPDFNDINDFPKSQQTKSCVVVEYYKQNYTNGKWWGEFRLIWSVKDELKNQGFLAVIDAKAKDGDLVGSSAAYVMKKEENENKWNVLYAKEKNNQKVDNLDQLKVLIPREGDAMKYSGAGIRWGFDVSDIGICDSTCLELKDVQHKLFMWELTGGGTLYSVSGWCEDAYSWLQNNFGWGKFLDKLKGISGKWEIKKQEVSEGLPEAQK